MILKIIIVIAAAICLADFITFLVCSLLDLPTNFTQGVCHPFFLPGNMSSGIVIRIIQLMVIIVGAVFFMQLPHLWKIFVPIGTVVLTIPYTVLFCTH